MQCIEFINYCAMNTESSTAKLAYIKHIDGIRAVAVILVILFHLEFPMVTGGFVGVDIFFVISGFLITRLIVEELQTTGKFVFFDFYLRRFKRIVPALCFTILITTPVAQFLLPEENLVMYQESIPYSIFSVSNFLFWKQSGYFATSSRLKPLLNTWSLGVEEQFYVIWPPILFAGTVCLKKILSLQLLVLLLFLLSLQLNFEFQTDHIEAVYYFMPFRIFEFCIGAILVWSDSICLPNQLSNAMLEICCFVGTFCIFFSGFTYDTTTVFPTYNAILPCTGTAFVICTGSATYMGKLFQNKISRFLGLISYSWYLNHWPIISFYSYYKTDPLSFPEKLAIFFCSMIMSVLMYHFVEQPVRNLKPKSLKPSAQILIFILAMIAVAVFGSMKFFILQQTNSKLLKNITLKVNNFSLIGRIEKFNKTVAVGRQIFESYYSDLESRKFRQKPWVGYISYNQHGWTYKSNTSESKRIVILGDSFATSLQHGLHLHIGTKYGISVWHSGASFCLPFPDLVWKIKSWSKRCRENVLTKGVEMLMGAAKSLLMIFCHWNNTIPGTIRLSTGQMVHKNLSKDYNYNDFSELVKGLDDLRKLIGNKKMVIIGMPCVGGMNGPFSCLQQNWGKSICRANFAFKYNSSISALNINKFLKHYSQITPYTYFVDPFDFFCPDKNMCNLLDPEGFPYFVDEVHLSRKGSSFLVLAIKNQLMELI